MKVMLESKDAFDVLNDAAALVEKLVDEKKMVALERVDSDVRVTVLREALARAMAYLELARCTFGDDAPFIEVLGREERSWPTRLQRYTGSFEDSVDFDAGRK